MSTKNILTGVVVALALILVAVVILVKTGVFDGAERTTEQEMIVETSMIVVTGTDADGNNFEYTMPMTYTRPKYSSNHTYAYIPKKTTTAVSTEASTTQGFVVESSAVQVTDPSGVPVTNENGEPVTELVTYTVPVTEPTTAPPTTLYTPPTSAVVVTDRWGQTKLDENGNPVTQIVTVGPPVPTSGDIWSESAEPATTSRFEIPSASPERNEVLAQAIIEQINLERYNSGLVPLTVSSELKTEAEMNGMAMALPNVYGEPSASGAYSFETEYGGNSLYRDAVAPAIAEKAMSSETVKVGVGVIEYNDKYYTTVIFG